MGVPGFFSWLIRKYKNKGLITSKTGAPVDILYLDANCLIHPQCFKVLDLNPDWEDEDELERMMMDRVLAYIDHLVDTVKPKELYIAVDGVAPMAKMNQQRKRRFRSKDDQLLRDSIKEKHGKKCGNRWSNSVITPGTEFMEILHLRILDHLDGMSKKSKKRKKIKTTYSSYHTAGEGEHKILQDIKSRNLDDKHCVIYGLDADLIFLALASGQRNLQLLREEQHFGAALKTKEMKEVKDKNAFDEEFNYVPIDYMKECINDHINKLVQEQTGKNNRYKHDVKLGSVDFTNDFVLLGCLLGNDFMPHLPSVNIRTNGLDILLKCYVEAYVEKKQMLVVKTDNNTTVSQDVLRLVVDKLAKFESYYFKKILPDYHERQNGRSCFSDDKCDIELWDIDNMRRFVVDDPIKLGSDQPKLWKFRYYDHHFNASEHQDDLIKDLVTDYLQAVVWVSKYYFETCCSYDWQFVHARAPFVSDISRFFKFNSKYDINSVEFKKTANRDTPIKPFTQLLAVLPPDRVELLPEGYRELVGPMSAIVDLYPTRVELDMLDKDMYFECMPRIPVVNINRIKTAISNIRVGKEDAVRNKVLECFHY